MTVLTRLLHRGATQALPQQACAIITRPRAAASTPIPSLTRAPVRQFAMPTNIRVPDQSELNATVARILPSSRYEAETTAFKHDQACSLLTKLLVQLRTAADLASVEDRKSYQAYVDADIISCLETWKYKAEDLTQLANTLLSASADPRRQPLAFRLFEVAHQAGSDDAGYYWASMVLQNTAPPPPSGDIKGRVQQAMTLYQELSAAGNALGSVGVARLMLQRVQRGQVEKAQWPVVVDEAVKLYIKAGETGLSEAWYDLASLFQESRFNPPDQERARTYLEKGAELGHSGCLFALGMHHLLEAEGSDKSKAFRLFKRAAEQGDAQSMFQVGSFYFLDRDKMAQHPDVTGGGKTMNQAHKDTFGVDADDVEARFWLEQSVQSDYPPSILQLATLLGQHRALDAGAHDERGLRTIDKGQADQLSYALLAKLLAILKTSGNLPSLPSQKGQWSNGQFNGLIPQAQAMYERLEQKLSDSNENKF
ncbi:uncharacterized protein MEPE_04839 [Melanopsichium pennsylvanicum]|uniref:Uncharacterized protein n=2 Tax=Melanopsichium pennsylvanicum TaxID=63383 RepID=A0AAJ5C6R3_9BASI|nr:sel1 domain-containing protein [Melanopsichium pennsylvanicum 4]SNX86130.1 uncharacterized protein MEPE_04839 [Melanopsichium pennsylvanicum]